MVSIRRADAQSPWRNVADRESLAQLPWPSNARTAPLLLAVDESQKVADGSVCLNGVSQRLVGQH